MSTRHPDKPPFKKGDPRARKIGQRGGQVTQAGARAKRGPWQGTIIDLMQAAGMTGPDWLPWSAFWKAVYALPMSPDELAIYQRHTKRDTPPTEQVDEAWMCIGRGAGKTRNAALHAVFRAITFDSSTVAAGESVTIPLLASDRDQASAALKYVRGFSSLGVVAPYVHRGDLASKAEFKTGVDVVITTASFSAPRGRTSPTACCDEIAFWSDEGANPDNEILLAVRGTLGRVPGSVLLVLSNPYSPRGELHKAVATYWSKDAESSADGVLVWNASTLAMRPSHPLRPIIRLRKADPVKAASEYGDDDYVQFRQGDAALFDEAPVRAAIVVGRKQLPPSPGVRYFAFIDMAEGSRSGDSATLAIAHQANHRAVLDCLVEIQPTFSPGVVIANHFVPVLRAYRLREVRGDHHARGWVEAALESAGLKFLPSGLTKSEIYLEALQLVNTGLTELLDDSRMSAQFLALQRFSARSGHDSVDHPRGGHDDVCNAAAGALVHVVGVGVERRRKVQVVATSSPSPGQSHDERMREQFEALGLLAKATIALREAQDRSDWNHQVASEHEPARNIVWVHDRQ